MPRYHPAVFACELVRSAAYALPRQRRFPAWPELYPRIGLYQLAPLTTAAAWGIRHAEYQFATPIELRFSAPDFEAPTDEDFADIAEAMPGMVPHIDSLKQLLSNYPRLSTNHSTLGNNLGALYSDLNQQLSLLWVREIEFPPEVSFNAYHELAHQISLQTPRPSQHALQSIAYQIYILLATVPNFTFWGTFEELSLQLHEVITNYFTLEELRANILGFTIIHPELQAMLRPQLYTELERSSQLSIYLDIVNILEGHYELAFPLTYIAESRNQGDPIEALKAIIKKLQSMNIRERVLWITQYYHFGIRFRPGVNWHDVMSQLPVRSPPSWYVTFSANFELDSNYLPIYFTHDSEAILFTAKLERVSLPVKLAVFYESLRQQLAQITGLRCPYMQGRECCGLGNRLEKVWLAIPEQFKHPHYAVVDGTRRSFRQPARQCWLEPSYGSVIAKSRFYRRHELR